MELNGAEQGRHELYYGNGQWGSKEDGSGRMNADVACVEGRHQQVGAGQGKQRYGGCWLAGISLHSKSGWVQEEIVVLSSRGR